MRIPVGAHITLLMWYQKFYRAIRQEKKQGRNTWETLQIRHATGPHLYPAKASNMRSRAGIHFPKRVTHLLEAIFLTVPFHT